MPTAVVVTPVHTAIVVSWSAPVPNGGPAITDYVAKVGAVSCTTTGSTCLLTGVKNYHRYTVSVTAYSPAGHSKVVRVPNVIPLPAQNCAYVGPYANLQGCNLSFANLGVDLTQADLAGATLYAATLAGANLTGADLTGADAHYANFHGTDLQGAHLSGANLSFISSGAVTGTPAALPTGWAVGDGYLMGPGVNLSFTDLSGLVFPTVDLSGASLYASNLTGATLSAATNFTGTNVQYAKFTGTDLQGVNLSTNDFTGITSGGVTGTPAALPTGWAVGDGYLMGPGVNLSFTDLSGLVFPTVDLSGASLYASNLTGADLTAVTNFTGTNVQYITWSNTTCPDTSNSDTNGSNPASCVGYGI